MLTLGTIITANARGKVLTGKVFKMNNKACKVHVTGGNTRFPVGSVVSVPYCIIQAPNRYMDDGMEVGENVGHNSDAPNPHAVSLVDLFNRASQMVVPPRKAASEYSTLWMQRYSSELCILMNLYNKLSPENLSADGERSAADVRALRENLNRKLMAMRILMDNDVPDEDVCWDLIRNHPEIFKK